MNLHDIDSLLVGTPEFYFAPDCSTVAQASKQGWNDFGNVVSVKVKGDAKKIEHFGNYRGKRKKDRIDYLEISNFGYEIVLDEFRRENLYYRVFGTPGTPDSFTQTAQVNSRLDPLTFSPTEPSGVNVWYLLSLTPPTPGARPADVRFLQGDYSVTTPGPLSPGSRAAGSVSFLTLPADGDTLTLSDGVTSQIFEFDSDNAVVPGNVKVVIGATASTTATALAGAITALATFGLAASSAAGAASVSLTNASNGAMGNVPITTAGAGVDSRWTVLGMTGGTAAGAGTTVALVEGLDFEFDATRGRIRFYKSQTGPVQVTAGLPAIDANSVQSMSLTMPKQKSNFTGLAHLMIWDQNVHNPLRYEHFAFGCSITAGGDTDLTGDKFAEQSLMIEVLSPEGTIFNPRALAIM